MIADERGPGLPATPIPLPRKKRERGQTCQRERNLSEERRAEARKQRKRS